MTAPKVKPNALPVSFDQFRKNPIAAVSFCMLVAVGYLYLDLRSGYKEQIEKANQKIEVLDAKIDKLTYALKKSDSCLAATMTEIRIMQTMKKL
jgi:archaellum component FlaF (FlaF/FlaG flagellin family)